MSTAVSDSILTTFTASDGDNLAVQDWPLEDDVRLRGVVMLVHWAQRTRRPVLGALLATPPDFERPMPDGYPDVKALRAGGWLPDE